MVVRIDAGRFHLFRVEVEELFRTGKRQVRLDDTHGEKERLVVLAVQHLHAECRVLMVGMILRRIQRRSKIHLA